MRTYLFYHRRREDNRENCRISKPARIAYRLYLWIFIDINVSFSYSFVGKDFLSSRNLAQCSIIYGCSAETFLNTQIHLLRARHLSFDNNRVTTVSMLIDERKDLPGVAVCASSILALCSKLPTAFEYVWRHSHHHVSFSTVGYSCTSPMHLLARFQKSSCQVISSINTHILS